MRTMSRRIFKVDRSIHFEPQKEIKYLLAFIGIFIYLFAANEYFSENEADNLSGQSRILGGIFVIFYMRLFTIRQWIGKYKESINYFFGSIPLDAFVKVSIYSILFDALILFCAFFLIDIEKVSFTRITVSSIVIIIVVGLIFLMKKLSSK